MSADTKPGGGGYSKRCPLVTEAQVPAPPTTLDEALALARQIGQQLKTPEGKENRALIEDAFLRAIAEE